LRSFTCIANCDGLTSQLWTRFYPGSRSSRWRSAILGERIVSNGRLHARGRASGAEVESPIAWLVEFRQLRVIRITDYLDPKEALEAAGLSE
jgi:hypothetical protein